jgi:hypothetical protein
MNSSECYLNGSMFDRRLPLKRTGSYGTIVTLYLSSWRPISSILMSSRLIDPKFPSGLFDSSKIRNKPKVREDFPLPVLPTTPIFSCLLIEKEIALITSGRSSLYLNVISLATS